jgi:NADH-quinone oxidoreductase subunit F/NADP-reducing hydrogenase subunit HndC
MGGLKMKQITSELELKEIVKERQAQIDLRKNGRFDKNAQEMVVRVCMESSCIGSGATKVFEEFNRIVNEYNGNKAVKVLGVVGTGCHGLCEIGPSVIINPGNILYAKVQPKDVQEIFEKHLMNGEVVERLLFHDHSTGEAIQSFEDVGFFKNQTRKVLGKNALMDPWTIEDYIALGGYQALMKAMLAMKPDEVLDVVKKSGLRGRGGAGFPTGTVAVRKNRRLGHQVCDCNGDEGDPGPTWTGRSWRAIPIRLSREW